MDNRSLFRALAIGALVIAAGAAIGVGAYNAGVAQGIALGGALAAPPAGAPYLCIRTCGTGRGASVSSPSSSCSCSSSSSPRVLAWRGRWRDGWRYRHDGVPPAFEEWHRRAHARCGRAPRRSRPIDEADPGRGR